jgi:acyl carrier protein
MTETVEQRCAHIFREIVGLQNPGLLSDWDDGRVLTEPLEAIDIDSLSRLDFIMRVESAYGIELDEADVNACRTIGELAKLVTAAVK